MAKQLNVNMKFNADSSQAKKELQDLQDQLHKLIMTSNTKIGTGIADDIREATHATAELSAHLQKATNVNTGNLDFSKLSQSMKASGKSLEQYGDQLRKLGPDGQQAFMKLTQAIVQSEVPLRRTNTLVKEFATTLANTARWQLSSSVLHGFMGALQSAYGYAQDLNESLNNIRIVTGASIDDMSRFAQEANKAAKALSTTTTAYTDASLIYFQQGLSEADVKKRADVTIKLANISRQSAADVSDQMTAIWNNFYDGSKSLEHYADVLTALGAATASSTDEIAGGLEKFAAIADTIGLSYDYAAAALATLTSNTRESEEVVGTALKTIFARIQGLSLGETLDDGTTLNKYSQALATVGINIKDANGNLKDMDDILDAMGSKWNQLSRDQQTALAQTVAGTRQYNQLMALMANWNNGDSDSFQANLATAAGADGALQEQADIYAEGWEAAQKRVTAAAEEMYKKLLNDEFFIDILNGIEKIIGFVDNLIDRLGGLKGLLFTIGTIVTKMFSAQISQGLTNAAYNLQMMTEKGRDKVKSQRSDFIKDAATKMAKAADSGEAGYDEKQAASIYQRQLEAQSKLTDNAERMTDIEKETVEMLMQQARFRDELTLKSAKEIEMAKQARSAAADTLYARGVDEARRTHKAYSSELIAEEMGKVKTGTNAKLALNSMLKEDNFSSDQIRSIFAGLNDKEKGIQLISPQQLSVVTKLSKALEDVNQTEADYSATIYKLSQIMEQVNQDIETHATKIIGASSEEIQNYAKAVEDVTKAEQKHEKAQAVAQESYDNINKSIDEAKGKQQTWSDILVAGTNIALSAASAISMLGSMFDTLKDPDVSGWEKFTTILTTLSMLIPTLVTMWSSLKTLISAETIEKIKNTAATIAQVLAEKALNQEKGKSGKEVKESIKETVKNTGKKVKETAKNTKEKIGQGIGNIKDKWNKAALAKDKNIEHYANGAFKAKGGTTEAKLSGGKFMNAKAAESVAGKTALKGLGKMAGGVGLIAAGVLVAVGAVKMGMAQFNKYSKAAEEAAKVAEGAAEAYNKVAESYNEFKATMNDYKTAKDGLKDLTKGTIEYQEAIMDANDAARKMIDQYENLKYTVNSDGLIEIDNDSLMQAQKAELDKKQKAQMSKDLTQISADQAKTKADSVDFLRDKVKSSSGGWASFGNVMAATGAGAGSGALIGAGVGLLGGPFAAITSGVGAAVGAVAGGIAGLATGLANLESASGKEQEAFDKLAKAYETDGAKISAKTDEEFKNYLQTELGIDDERLVNSLVENRTETERLCREMSANAAATKALNATILSSALSGNKAVQDSDYTEEIINTSTKTFEADKQAKLKQLQDSGWGTKKVNAWSGKNDKQAQAYLAEYARAAGIEGAILTGVSGNDKNRRFKFKDADGTEREVDLNTMMNQIATSTATDKAKGAEVPGNLKDAKLAELESKGWGTRGVSWASGKNDKQAQAVWDEYVKAAGLTGDAAVLGKIKGNDKNRRFVDSTGKEISLEDMKEAVASAYEKENAQGRGTDIANIYNKLNKSEAAALNAATNQDYDTLNIGQLKNGFSLSASTVTDADLEKMGYTREEFTQAMVNAQAEAKKVWNETLNTHTSGAQTALTSIAASTNEGLQSISHGTLKAYGDMLEGFGESGEMTEFNTALTDIMTKNADKAEAIMQAATGIDWSQGQVALDQFNGQLYDMGIDIEANAESWQAFQDAVNSMSFSVVNQNLETMRSTLATIGKLAKDVKFGDVISDEDYKQLTELNGSLKKDFVMTADGYMYVGDQDLEKSAKSSTKTQLAKTKENNVVAKAAYNALQQGVFKTEDWNGLITGTDGDAASITMANSLANNETILSALGVDSAYMASLSSALSSGDTAAQEAARERLKAIYNDIATLESNYSAGLYDDISAESVAASQMGLAELEAAIADGTISAEVGEKFKTVLEQARDAVELEEAERYHEINEELQTMSSQLDTIGKLKERAFGAEKIDLMKQEVAILQDQMLAQSDYISEIRTNLASDKTKIANYGFTFDENNNISNYDKIYKQRMDAWNQAQQQHATGDMSDTAFAEAEKAWNTFKENTAQYESTLDEYASANNTLIDMSNQYYESLANSYTEALSDADAELAKYTARLDHHAQLLEHSKNLLVLAGRETDYKALGEILSGQAKVARNNLFISESMAKTYKAEAESLKAKMDAEVEGSEMFEVYKQQWEAAEEKAREAENSMLSDLQTWAQTEKEILNNTLADLGRSLEKTLTGGKTFDQVATEMERAKSLQEEYLTTTNQIYETTKMMRTAQQAIDSTSNTVAKNKLKNFITETKQMQEQEQLSKYELDMQQAKYDLLVAEIALEEAQNAKSMVRLQRDSEGNFGYVYTADASAVAEAQQQFDDAENTLYNKGLEGANDYTQKYQQTMAEMTDTLAKIQSDYMAGEYENEGAYHAAMLDAKQYYYQQLETYSQLYGVALSSNARISEDAWSSSFSSMVTSTAAWSDNVNQYISGAMAAFGNWSATVEKIEEITGSDLISIASNVKAITDENSALAVTLDGENGIIDKMGEQLKSAQDIATAYGKQADELQKVLDKINLIKSAVGITVTSNIGDDVSGGAATGGLTSEWGPEGKMLMVHENELILNSDQTNKFFDNLAIMESILSVIDSYAIGQQLGGILASPGYGGNTMGTLEQNVKIEASFPNVTDKNEIEEALNNLVNKASQYANRQ